ncbi:MAG: ABC transporter permease [Xanthobacteraceae bacterium]|nr:ABC transporter permease [Xanthobacteraceae bacterium]
MRARVVALSRQIARLYPLLLVIVAWQAAAQFGWVRPAFLPSFSSVVLKAWVLAGSGELWSPLFVSLYRAGAGLALAIAIGIPVGFLMARWRPVWRALDPLVAFAYPAPKLAFVPIFILWFGIDHLAKILLVAFSCTFPIIISAYSGALTVSVRQIWAAQAMGTPPLTLFRRIILPAALPSLLSGLRISIPLALLTAFTAEMVSGGGGLGGGLVLAQRYFESETVFVYILTMLISGYVIDSLFLMARRWILRWDESEAVSAG